MIDVYVSIGNSDNKLTQGQWARFCNDLEANVRNHAYRIYGVWHSLPNSTFQNMCIAFGVYDEEVQRLRRRLKDLATVYMQDSIAWFEGTTSFLEAD